MIYIVTATRNRKDLTLQYLDCISKQTYKEYKVVIVDDGSTDGTVEYIRDKYPEVEVIEGNGNLWWTGATRLGVDYAIKSSTDNQDYILIQNDDTYFDSNFLKSLLDLSRKYNGMIVGSTVKSKQTGETIYNCCRLISGTYRPYIDTTTEEIVPTETMGGRGVLVPIQVFKIIGNFSTSLPHYGADYDFFCRARKAGFKLGYSREVITYGTSIKPNLSQSIKLKKLKGERLSLKDFTDLFFSRRSSNNLYSSIYLTLLHSHGLYKLYGIARTIMVFLKFILFDIPISNIKSRK